MPSKTEYFIKRTNLDGNRYGLYMGDTLIGLYPNYQRARRDMIRMREQVSVANDWNILFTNDAPMSIRYSTNTFSSGSSISTFWRDISSSAITLSTSTGRPLTDAEVREIEGLVVNELENENY